ncbi:hypothetical protein EMPS_08271 [Entomortierella parvispora]|uniref:Major facilitator superfamily (MFS) profile domain-containing protein n=1 Tax=Entomortierella parvispora TaxID=205924 RepID=A0A9P3HG25_9FUNG|nr:hypothetical protein EMPS_08271 [Entomortierella parvispora]
MASSTKAPSVHSDNATVVIESEKKDAFTSESTSNESNDFNNGGSKEHASGEKEEVIETDSSGQKEEIIDSASSTKDSSHGNLDPGPPMPSQGVVTLPFRELMVVFTGLMLGIFLSSLDQTIVSVCTTKIASEFNSLNEIPWIGTAYLLTSTAFQPLYGKSSDIFGRKSTFLFAIGVFLLGSALCGAAQNMTWIIIARGVAGVGAAGIMSGVMIIITDLVSLRDRGKYQGIIGGVFGIASVIGPLLGGVLTDHATWRWAFFINLPIGAITIFTVIKVLHLPHAGGSLKTKLARVDFAGSLSLIAGLVMILLPLNWGGSTYPWDSARVIGLFCAGFVVLLIFCYIEVKVAVEPIIPFRLFKKRTSSAVFATSFFIGMGFFGIMFFMPLYFQIVRQESATSSGLEMLPMIVGLLIASITSGFMVSKWGQYRPFIWTGLVLATTGIGLLTLLNESSNRGEIIGYLFINGLGLGFCMQTVMLAIQSGVETRDIAVATANATFFRTVGSVFGVAISGTVFNNAVKNHLGPIILANPQYDVASVITDPYNVKNFPQALQDQILHGYMLSLRQAFTVCIPFMGAAFLVSLLIRHHKLRKTLGPQTME